MVRNTSQDLVETMFVKKLRKKSTFVLLVNMPTRTKVMRYTVELVKTGNRLKVSLDNILVGIKTFKRWKKKS